MKNGWLPAKWTAATSSTLNICKQSGGLDPPLDLQKEYLSPESPFSRTVLSVMGCFGLLLVVLVIRYKRTDRKDGYIVIHHDDSKSMDRNVTNMPYQGNPIFEMKKISAEGNC